MPLPQIPSPKVTVTPAPTSGTPGTEIYENGARTKSVYNEGKVSLASLNVPAHVQKLLKKNIQAILESRGYTVDPEKIDLAKVMVEKVIEEDKKDGTITIAYYYGLKQDTDQPLIRVNTKNGEQSVYRVIGAVDKADSDYRPDREKAGWDVYDAGWRLVEYTAEDMELIERFKNAQNMPAEHRDKVSRAQKAVRIYRQVEGEARFEEQIIMIFTDKREIYPSIVIKSTGFVDFVKVDETGYKQGQDTYEYDSAANSIGEKRYVSNRTAIANIDQLIDRLRQLGHKDAASLLEKEKNYEAYEIFALDNGTKVSTWTAVFRKGNEDEVIKINESDFSIDVVMDSPYTGVASIKYLYEKDAQGKHSIGDMRGVSIVIGEESMPDGKRLSLRLVYEPKRDLYYIEGRAKTDHTLEKKFKGRYSGDDLLAFLTSQDKLQGNALQNKLAQIGNAFGREEVEEFTYGAFGGRSKVFLRSLNIATQTNTTILLSGENANTVKSRSNLSQMELSEGMIRLKYDRYDAGRDADGGALYEVKRDSATGQLSGGVKQTRETKENGNLGEIDFLDGTKDVFLYNGKFGRYGIADKTVRVVGGFIDTISNNTAVDGKGNIHFVKVKLNPFPSERVRYDAVQAADLHNLFISGKVIALQEEIQNNEGEGVIILTGHDSVSAATDGNGNLAATPMWIAFSEFDDFGFSKSSATFEYRADKKFDRAKYSGSVATVRNPRFAGGVVIYDVDDTRTSRKSVKEIAIRINGGMEYETHKGKWGRDDKAKLYYDDYGLPLKTNNLTKWGGLRALDSEKPAKEHIVIFVKGKPGYVWVWDREVVDGGLKSDLHGVTEFLQGEQATSTEHMLMLEEEDAADQKNTRL